MESEFDDFVVFDDYVDAGHLRALQGCGLGWSVADDLIADLLAFTFDQSLEPYPAHLGIHIFRVVSADGEHVESSAAEALKKYLGMAHRVGADAGMAESAKGDGVLRVPPDRLPTASKEVGALEPGGWRCVFGKAFLAGPTVPDTDIVGEEGVGFVAFNSEHISLNENRSNPWLASSPAPRPTDTPAFGSRSPARSPDSTLLHLILPATST